MDFKCSDLGQWKEALSSYGVRIESLNKPNLVSLDDFYRNELTGVLRQRNPSYITTADLTKLMQWKLTRVKWRPRLFDFVSSLDDAVVRSASEKAFQSLPDISKAISELTVLKGVGPATASAVLAAFAPDIAPFMLDEAMVAANGVMEEWFGQHWWTVRSNILLLTTLLVFVPLVSFKRVDSLRYTSAMSVALAVAFVVITAGIVIVKFINGSIAMPRLLPKLIDQASFWKLFTTVPVLVTAYICHHNIHPIENELRDGSQMKSIVRTSIALCTTVYVATSFFGFLLFGDHTLDDVLANFDGELGIPYSSLLNDVVRVSYVIHLMLVFPIVFFSLRLNMDGLFFPYAIPIAYDNRRFFSVTAALICFIFLGANCVPSIWDAFQFTGATATVSVGFIFPAAIVLRDTNGIATKRDRLVSWVMILLAVSSSTVAICSDIYSIFNIGVEA